jgi:hypothetical protein
MHTALKVFLMTLFAAGIVWPQSSKREATIQSMIGSVKVRKGDSQIWKDARPKMQLKEKDALRTFVESQVEIMTTEGTVVRVEENSTLELSAFKQFENGAQSTKITILNGAVFSNVKKLLTTSSKFEFETPTATASIRGTKVGFEVSPEKTSVKVFEGEVMVTPKGASNAISVKTNQMTVIVKDQKTPTVEVLTERDKKSIGNPDSVHKDTMHLDSANFQQIKSDSLKKDSARVGSVSDTTSAKGLANKNGADTLASVQTPMLTLAVSTPSDNQIFSLPSIPVIGTTTPGADVSVNGIRCQVNSNGSFSAKIPIPDEENAITLDIESALKGAVQRVSRQIIYKPTFTLTVGLPQNQQMVNATSVSVAGQVSPAKAEVTVSDIKIPVLPGGKFAGFVSIPDEEGQVNIVFEATYQGASKSETRTVVYKRLIDANKPSIQPTQLPKIASVNELCFTVFDKTPDDEITFFTSIDGSSTMESGQPNSNFCLQLQEGVHNYMVYAEDKAHNRTQPLSGSIGYLKSRPVLQVRKPSRSPEVVRVPPGRPGDAFKPIYTVEFSILNLPDNDMRVIKNASMKNESTGQLLTQKDLIDNTLDFDIELQRGENRMTIQVTDINNNVMQYPSPVIIDVR